MEIETPKRFLVVPFNPIPDTYYFADTRKGRTREVVMHWRQNPIREFKDKIISFFEEKTWKRWIYEAKLRLKRVLRKNSEIQKIINKTTKGNNPINIVVKKLSFKTLIQIHGNKTIIDVKANVANKLSSISIKYLTTPPTR